MKYEKPFVTDLGSIADHTFFRCSVGNPTPEPPNPPKDPQDFPLDKHGECSSGHAFVVS
jgi:hypothetical protein